MGPQSRVLEFHTLHSSSPSHPLLYVSSQLRMDCSTSRNTEHHRSIELWIKETEAVT